MVIPGPSKLIVFQLPADLPLDCRWRDLEAGTRQFSANFLAALLCDEFQVSTVLCLEVEYSAS